jgi:hypothetical protein
MATNGKLAARFVRVSRYVGAGIIDTAARQNLQRRRYFLLNALTCKTAASGAPFVPAR